MDKNKSIINMIRFYECYKSSIESLQEQLELLQDNAGVGATDYDSISSGATNKITSMVEDIAIKNTEERDRLQKQIAENEFKVRGVDRALDMLTDNEREVIEGTYWYNRQGHEIANKLNVSTSSISNIKKAAITKMRITVYGY